MIMYGGGWCYDRKGKCDKLDIYSELIRKGVFFTDYTKKTSPKVMKLLGKAKAGDIIYLKSYYIKKQTLKIQAIGYFIDDELIEETIGGQKGIARRINWVNELSTPISFEIPSARKYNTTFYEENRVENILEIMKCLNEK